MLSSVKGRYSIGAIFSVEMQWGWWDRRGGGGYIAAAPELQALVQTGAINLQP